MLKPTSAKKIDKSLNKKLEPSFIYNNIYLKNQTTILITKLNNKDYELKTYD